MNNKYISQNILAEISHELQTPAAIVQGNIDLLIPVVPKRKRQVLIKARNSIKRASKSISHLIGLIKYGSMIKAMRMRDIELFNFLDELTLDLKPLTKSKGIKLKFFCSKRALMFCDQEFLKEVFYNLIINSIRHTRRGGSITIRSKTQGKFIKLTVSDTGRGMARAELEKIYDYFYSGKVSSLKGGHGLGLHICQEIIKAHHGEISVVSRPGYGSVFSITLPRVNIVR